MNYNLVTNIQWCHQMIAETVPLGLVYYSHIPTAVVSLLVGFFVFFKNRKSLISKLLLGLSLTFSMWLMLSLVVWVANYNSALTMVSWAPLGMLNALFFACSLYFVYVFIDKKDISFFKKVILGLLLLPIVISTPLDINLAGFTMDACEAIEMDMFLNYLLFFEILVSAWIIIFSVQRYLKADDTMRKQIKLLLIGISLFLISFFAAGYYATYVGDFRYELYGLFGMTVFMGFLAYLIVQYKAFNIKLLAAQALVTALVILIASQYLFVRNATNQILTGVTLILALGFGYMLIKSIKAEVERKEQLQKVSDSLAKANDRLRELDNAKSEFISIASHQLRTPLTAIKGFVSLLLEGSYGKLTPKVADVLAKVDTSNTRLVDLVEDLLNLSRIEAGRMEYDFGKVQLTGIIEEIYDTFAVRAKDKKISLEFEKPKGEIPEVTTDKTKIREVISNLVDNAIKYTPKGNVTVRIAPAGEFVRVSVSDTGIGISPEELPYLFQKFSRGKDSVKINVSSTGLGLHVGKKMMEAMGGRIGVDSKGAGAGSTFWVEAPREMGIEIM
ncbi:MAG: sensor signal transduction histidine kinase [Patescibacteria group bacterium]|nr:sensor signal transduction histidine kinase [Patescibacteria group bacterium]